MDHGISSISKFRMFTPVVAGVFGLLLSIVLYYFELGVSDSTSKVLILFFSAMMSAGVILMTLQADTLPKERFEIEVLRYELEELRSRIGHGGSAITEEERNNLKRDLADRVHSELTAGVLKAEIERIRIDQKTILEKERHEVYWQRATARLIQQISALGSRANLNLVIGLGLAVGGIAFLFHYVNTGLVQSPDLSHFMVQFFPRLSLVAIIELFSYFFLRLYRQAIDEIKYFQNEITNLELKMLAADLAQNAGKANLQLVVTALASTERNFLISKEQRGVFEARNEDPHTATERLLDKLNRQSPSQTSE